ncbi:hypothetical protein [Pseudomonas sp. Marseille-Q5115]|uniref:hypothetical protein n=1 Tax=Pseudomonas sp. Marseille-Q5115 TaxID=2866593 RepID=UPI001CE49F1D|nr:hypothetical protein [Pseudomonas sp. Marseille-Q5115]
MINETTENNGAHEGTDELAARVRTELETVLAEQGLNNLPAPDRIYLNGVNNLEERLVIYSQTLTEETTRRIQEQDPPSAWVSDTFGVFFVAYSFEDEHRIPDVSGLLMGEIVGEVYQRLV